MRSHPWFQAKVIEGAVHTLGPVIGITPWVTDDGSAVDLEVDVVANIETADAGVP